MGPIASITGHKSKPSAAVVHHSDRASEPLLQRGIASVPCSPFGVCVRGSSGLGLGGWVLALSGDGAPIQADSERGDQWEFGDRPKSVAGSIGRDRTRCVWIDRRRACAYAVSVLAWGCRCATK